MNRCISCGKQIGKTLCDDCKANKDLEKLCMDVINFVPKQGMNELWDEMAGALVGQNMPVIVNEISENIPSPRREYIQIIAQANNREYVPKAYRQTLYSLSESLLESTQITEEEKARILGLELSSYSMDYEYFKAEEILERLLRCQNMPRYCYYAMIDFFTKTRRYAEAEDMRKDTLERFADADDVRRKLEYLQQENNKRNPDTNENAKEYMPNPREAKEKYASFENSIGIDVRLRSKRPEKGPEFELNEVHDWHFDSFVAFDFETTGFHRTYDCIIDVGAIKVIDGQVVESAEYTFSEFVKPDKKRISPAITELTGIANEDVRDARPVWEVIPDFMKFVGDLPLVGYNNHRFDNGFLIRAARNSHMVIKNPIFDAMTLARKCQGKLRLEHISLESVSECLSIRNNRAHRALPDAVATAKVFLKLRKML